jgi:hypothetical protein
VAGWHPALGAQIGTFRADHGQLRMHHHPDHADSFGVRRSAVRLVSGVSGRTKIVDTDTDTDTDIDIDIDDDAPRLLASLLAAPGRLRPRRDVAAIRPSLMSEHMTRSADAEQQVTDGVPYRRLRAVNVALSAGRPSERGIPICAALATTAKSGDNHYEDAAVPGCLLCRFVYGVFSVQTASQP